MENFKTIDSSENDKINYRIIDPSEFDKEEYKEYIDALKYECSLDEDDEDEFSVDEQLYYPVAEVSINNRKYYISCVDDDIVFDNGRFSFVDDDYLYTLTDTGVERKAFGSKVEEVFTSMDYKSQEGLGAYTYSQFVNNKNGVVLSFIQPEDSTDANFLYFLSGRRADFVQFIKTFIVFNRIKGYRYLEDEDAYFKFKVVSAREPESRSLQYSKRGAKSYDDINEDIEKTGYHTHVPREIINVYADSDLNVKCLKKTTEMYHRETSY